MRKAKFRFTIQDLRLAFLLGVSYSKDHCDGMPIEDYNRHWRRVYSRNGAEWLTSNIAAADRLLPKPNVHCKECGLVGCPGDHIWN